jgi:parallel beta-helix repeat protein
MKTTKLISKVLSGALLTVALSWTLTSKGAVITVPSRGILTIQQGIDAAAAGDTVRVMPGTYTEAVGQWWPPIAHVPQEKSGLKLLAAGAPDSVRIIGPGFGRGIIINAEGVSVAGFHISGFSTGIIAGGAPNRGGRITRNIIHNCSSECLTVSGSTSYEIDLNTFDGGANGVFLNGWPGAGPNTRHLIHHNVLRNADTGIFLWLSPECVIEHNELSHSGSTGIYIASSPGCTLEHNQANDGQAAGIVVSGSPDCEVSHNTANNNTVWGIAVIGSCGSNFSHNSAEGNGEYDLFAPNWDNTEATCNTYSANRAGAALPSLSLWDAD